MDTVLGFLELIAWAAAVIAIAAAVTYTVIKLFPSREERPGGAGAAGDAGADAGS